MSKPIRIGLATRVTSRSRPCQSARTSAFPRAPRRRQRHTVGENGSAATFTISAPVARRATRCRADRWGPSKSWCESTTRRRQRGDRSSKCARASMSTCRTSGRLSNARRSSSGPLKAPPSHVGRHVTMMDHPASAPATFGSATGRVAVPQVGAGSGGCFVATPTNSAVVVAVTVRRRSGHKSLFSGWAEGLCNVDRAVAGQARRCSSS